MATIKVKAVNKESESLNGFDREAMLAGSKEIGIVEYCYSASSGTVYVIGSEEVGVANTNNFKIETSRTTFADGSALADLTLCHSADPSLTSFKYWRKGNLIEHTVAVKVTVALDFKGYIYYNTSDVLVANSTLGTADLIKNTVLVAQVYNNEHTSSITWFGDERHGILQDGETHLQQHGFPGFWREFGLDITGFDTGNDTFTGVAFGIGADEDIAQLVLPHATIPKMYAIGDDHEYTFDDDDNRYEKAVSGVANWNDVSGSAAVLTPVTGNDRITMTLIACNNKLAPLAWLVGQELYSNRSDARNKADSAWTRLALAGLPSHEYTRVYMAIISAAGAITAGADGEVGCDYRDGFPAKYYNA